MGTRGVDNSVVKVDLSRVPTELFIDGEWQQGHGDEPVKVFNPATDELLAEVASATATDGAKALAAVERAQESFAAMPARERAHILLRAHTLLLERRDEVAAVMTAEMGKPFNEARGEVDYSASYLEWYAHEGVRLQGTQSESPSGRGQILLSREPVGPSLLITPWNFPLAMGARKIAPAIATGCGVIVKPAEATPLTMLLFASILHEAGAPAGTVNVLTTNNPGDLTSPLLASGTIRHLSFTGSTKVGRILHNQCSEHMIRTSLELGGNAPFIIFDDVDVDRAVTEVLAAKLRNMGEACTAANRIFVHESIADEFTQKLAAKFAALTVGDGLEAGTDIGPMIDHASCERIQELVENAVSIGAQVAIGGTLPKVRGSFYPPTVLTNVQPESRLMREEIFGPVAPIVTFSDEADVISLANNTEYGLAGYIMTDNLGRALRVSRKLELGMVGINSGIISDAAAPLGGVKASGLGREGGVLGIDEFLEYKYTFIPHE